jgi:hypothetical protein
LANFGHGSGYAITFLEKKHWATFWAIFSQTHLVTLLTGVTFSSALLQSPDFEIDLRIGL